MSEPIGLADGLPLGVRQGDVFIGMLEELVGDELLARHPFDGRQHPGIGNTLAPQFHDQLDDTGVHGDQASADFSARMPASWLRSSCSCVIALATLSMGPR